jgi:hypothetical protein
MSQLTQAILTAAQALPEGGMVSPKEFLHLAVRAAIDQAMARLAKEGKLLRIARGAYVVPLPGRFGLRAPSTESVLKSLEKTNGETIVAAGAFEANALGLTTQVPTREVFMTSGASRTLQLGRREIEIKHAPRWQLALGSSPAGMAVRALSWAGAEKAASAVSILRTKLASDEWHSLQGARAMMPSWMARAISADGVHA